MVLPLLVREALNVYKALSEKKRPIESSSTSSSTTTRDSVTSSSSTSSSTTTRDSVTSSSSTSSSTTTRDSVTSSSSTILERPHEKRYIHFEKESNKDSTVEAIFVKNKDGSEDVYVELTDEGTVQTLQKYVPPSSGSLPSSGSGGSRSSRLGRPRGWDVSQSKQQSGPQQVETIEDRRRKEMTQTINSAVNAVESSPFPSISYLGPIANLAGEATKTIIVPPAAKASAGAYELSEAIFFGKDWVSGARGFSNMVGAYGLGALTGASLGNIASGVGLIGRGAIAEGAASHAFIKAGTDTLVKQAQLGTVFTGFDAGVELITKGKVNESISTEHLARNYFLSGGVMVASVPISEAVRLSGATGLRASLGISGGVGAIVGPAFSATVPNSDVARDTAAVMGLTGILGLGHYAVESTGIRPVLGRTEYRVYETKTNTAIDVNPGLKVGIEIAPKELGGGKIQKGEFIGIQTGKPPIGEGKITIPKGIAEETAIGGKYKTQTEKLGQEFFSNELKPSESSIQKNIEITAKEYTQSLISSARETGGVFKGSNVERSIPGRTEVNPRFEKKPGDIDIEFYSYKDFLNFKKQTENYVKWEKSKPGGQHPIEDIFSQHWKGKIRGGGNIDLAVVESSHITPKPRSPLADFFRLGTIEKGKNFDFFSSSQQIGSKYTSVGVDVKGNIKPIEPTKTKYMYDVASMKSKSKGETIRQADYLFGERVPRGDLPSVRSKGSSMSLGLSFSSSSTSSKSSSSGSLLELPSFSKSSSSSDSASRSSGSFGSSDSFPSWSSDSSSSWDSSPSSSWSSEESKRSEDSSFDFSPSSNDRITFEFPKWEIVPRIPQLPFSGWGSGLGGFSAFGEKGKGKLSKQMKNLLNIFR